MTDFNTDEYNIYLTDQINDNWARGYDSLYLDHFFGDIMPSFNIKDANVLDVGARAFESWEYFLEKYNKEITGIDIGREGLDFCKDKKKTGMIECDAHRMTERFQPESFDFIIAFHSFEHMYDLPLVLKNCHTLLKPDGVLYFSLPYRSFNWKKGHWYDVKGDADMMRLCREAGFEKEIHREVISDYRYRPEKETLGVVRK